MRRSLGIALTLALTVSLSDVVHLPEAAVAAPTAKPQAPLNRGDEAAALITARVSGQPVTITGLTTETSEFVAQPNGTVESTIHAAPVRVQAGGKWVPVDLNLRRGSNGAITAVAHPEDLTLAAGRTGESGALATVGSGADKISMGWSGALPEPVLDGTRATYPEARPGIDLVMESTRTGFEQFIVVKSREAAARIGELSLPLTGKSLVSHTRDASGALIFKDKAGRTVATSPTPLMWDAQVGADGQTPKRRTVVKTTTAKRAKAGIDLKLSPNLDWITDPATTFPVTIDPQVSVGAAFDTYVTDGDTGDRSGVNNLQIGLLSGTGGKRTRSFVAWRTSALRGKQITAATASFYNYYSTTCTANSWEIWSTNAFDASTRWSNQPTWIAKEGSSTTTKGFSSSCADAYVSVNATSFFQRAATANQARAHMGIRATSETATSAYKQFRSLEGDDNAQVPKATVTYNSYPVVGARSTTPSAACATGTARPYIGSKTPQLKTKLTDTEGSSMTASFEWSTTAGAGVTTVTTAKAASGTTFSTTIPAGSLAENASYRWRVRGHDGTGYSPWSAYCEFTVDTTAPGTPSVASTDYPAGEWAGGAGSSGKFDLAAASVTDVAAYEYGLDVNPPDQSVNAPALGTAATVTITPGADGAHTLYVRSRDRAGNRSAVKSYGFFAGVAAITAPHDGDLTAGLVAIEGRGGNATTGVTYQWRRGDTDAWATIPTGHVTVAAEQRPVTWPLAVAAGGVAPKLNWSLETTVNSAEAGPDPLDGPVQLRGVFTGGPGGTSKAVKLTLDRNRAWADKVNLGVGNLNLITGDLSVEQQDVSSGIGLGRTANTRVADDVDPMFGAGWTSSIAVSADDSGYTDLIVTGSLVQVQLADGATIGFTKTSNTSFQPQIGMEALGLSYTSSSDSYTLSDQGSSVVTFGRSAGQAAGKYVPISATAKGSGEEITYSWQTVTVGGTVVVRPAMALSPSPSGVACSASSLVRGCRATNFNYAATTTASGASAAQWGDFAGRVKEVTFTAWDPDASPAGMKTVVLMRYSYDNTGRLRSSWDPRLDWTESGEVRHLGTSYAYQGDGVLSEVRPPGEEPWNLTYTVVPGDTGKGRLAQVSRGVGANLARTNAVYRVPVSGGGAPYDLSAGQTTRWAQPEPPVLATAVFPATQVPNGNQANGTMPTSYERAVVSYLDANGRTINTAEPGGYINSQWFDNWGNQRRTLSPANRKRALDDSPTDDVDREAILARGLSNLNIFTADGSLLTGTLAPEREVTLPDGSAVRGRPQSSYIYDEGAPSAEDPFNLVTTESRMVRVWGSEGAFYDADKRVTKTTYDWELAEPLTETVDPGGLNLVTRYQYDTVTKQRSVVTAPGGNATGNTPATQRTVYYRAGTGSGRAACDNRPEFAELACRIEPGGQAETGPELPTKTMTYDMFNQPRVTTESTSAGVLRTTVVTYDAAARPERRTVTAAAGLGKAVPTTRNIFDRATGQTTRVQSLDVSGAVTAEVVRVFDGLGRLTSYTDADGVASTFGYDLLDRPTTITDGRASRTYGYDGGSERRQVPTSLVDSLAGTYTAAYDADGAIVTQQWPNGITVKTDPNEAGEVVSIAYSQSGCVADDCTLFAQTQTSSTHGQARTQDSSLSHQDLSYDAAGRLTGVRDTFNSNCVSRTFRYDTSTNRTETASYDPAEDGECQAETVKSRTTRGYDQADRLNTAGYEYDALGRTRTIPATDSAMPGGAESAVSYYQSDMAHKIVQDDRTSEYELDVIVNRFRSWTETRGTATAKKINHYSGDGDSPSWTDEGNNTITRPILGLVGLVGSYNTDTGAVTSITNLHGDVVAGTVGSTPGVAYTSDYLEDGQLRNTEDTGTRRYGWLGAEQRASDTPNGLTLMGARLYNSGTGRFLSTDPVHGGNANAYDYCGGDGVNCADTTGLYSCWRDYWVRTTYGRYAYYKGSYRTTVGRCNFSHKETRRAILSWGIIGGIFSVADKIASSIPGGQVVGRIFGLVGALIALVAGALGLAYFWKCNGKGVQVTWVAVTSYSSGWYWYGLPYRVRCR